MGRSIGTAGVRTFHHGLVRDLAEKDPHRLVCCDPALFRSVPHRSLCSGLQQSSGCSFRSLSTPVSYPPVCRFSFYPDMPPSSAHIACPSCLELFPFTLPCFISCLTTPKDPGKAHYGARYQSCCLPYFTNNGLFTCHDLPYFVYESSIIIGNW